MKVNKVADIVQGEIIFCGRAKSRPGDVAAILTNLEEVENPDTDFQWRFVIEIGNGPEARRVLIELPALIRKSDYLANPLFFADSELVFFRDRLFMAERPPRTPSEREEVTLRVKKAVYDDDAALANLKASVGNLEAAIEFARSGPRRAQIPEDVKLLVWTRDGGACVRCGSREQLHFDHIIPVSKGGASTAENIQILCCPCNLKKADRISSL